MLACACIALGLFDQFGVASAEATGLSGISAIFQRGNLDEAKKRLRLYLLKMPHSAQANDLLGRILLREGHYGQAEEAFQKATAVAPALLEPRLDLGDAFLAQGNTEEALGAYQAAHKLAPHDVRANLALAKLFMGAGKFALSLQAAANIPEKNRTAELLPTLAADYLGLQQTEKANVEIQGMLTVAQKQPDVVPELAEIFIVNRDFKSAQQLLDLAKTKLQPETDRFLIDLARTQAGLGQLNEAQNALENVLERTPQSVDALIAAGHVAGQQSNWVAATEAFSRAAQIAPERPDILYGLGSAQLYEDNPLGALNTAEKLRSITPDDPRSIYLLALALFGAKRSEDAKPYAEQVLKAHPEDRETNLILADIALNTEHDLATAQKRVNICLRSNSEDPGALYYLGMIQKTEGDVEGATKSLGKSVLRNAKNADAQSALGSLYLQAGKVPEAIRALEQASLLAPNDSQNHYQLALAYSRVNVPEKAKAELEIYRQMKDKEAKDAKDFKGPSISDTPLMQLPPHP